MPIIANQQPPTPRRKKTSPWGLILVVLVALARLFPHFIPLVGQVFSSRSLSIPPGLSAALPWVVGGLFVALLVVPSIIRQARRSRTQSDGRLSTTIQAAQQTRLPQVAQPRTGRTLSPQPEAFRQAPPPRPLPASMQPKPLRFERALNGKVIFAGVIWGGLLAGGLLVLRLLHLI